MIRIVRNPVRSEWDALLSRASSDDSAVRSRVEAILARVRAEGDSALRALALEIDGAALESIAVSGEEILEAEALVGNELKEALAVAAGNIRRFHEAQIPGGVDLETMPGVRCMQRAVPLRRVGIYVPGGSAPLVSTVLMLAIPASVAGCGEVVMCTPCGRDGRVAPAVLYAAKLCGVTKVFKIGGAQAIAAMAYGTESVPAVDKIFGPGNRYVTCAKEIVSMRDVAIDMPAGPSEVMVLADESAEAAFIAADLLSQAEHGADSQAILVTTSADLAGRVVAEVERQLALLPRAEIARQALGRSLIAVLASRDEMIEMANSYAPEHLIVSVSQPWTAVDRITTAGSVFVGNYTPESAGDYASGTNHTLPTAGWARVYGGVGTESFMRRMTVQEITPAGLQALGGVIVAMAEAEGLDAHAAAVKIRNYGTI